MPSNRSGSYTLPPLQQGPLIPERRDSMETSRLELSAPRPLSFCMLAVGFCACSLSAAGVSVSDEYNRMSLEVILGEQYCLVFSPRSLHYLVSGSWSPKLVGCGVHLLKWALGKIRYWLFTCTSFVPPLPRSLEDKMPWEVKGCVPGLGFTFLLW